MNKPGEWFRRVDDATEQYMTRWFVTDKEQVAKQRALEEHIAQQSKTLLKPRSRGAGGRRRRRDDGGAATAARLRQAVLKMSRTPP